jgi:ribonuclease D
LAEKPVKAESVAPEPIVLTAEQEKSYAALRNWRNEQASQTGLAPYMIAHNDSLMQIAILQVKSKGRPFTNQRLRRKTSGKIWR